MKSIKLIYVFLSLLLLGNLSCTQEGIIDPTIATLTFNNTSIPIDATGTDDATLVFYTTFTPSVDTNIPVTLISTNLEDDQISVPANAVLPAGSNRGEFELSFSEVDFLSSPNLTLAFDENGGLRKTFTVDCASPNVVVNIVFDFYPSETSWEIRNSNNEVILFNEYASGATQTTEGFCLPSGDYIFIIYDQFGDGICCAFGEGSYTVTLGDGTVVASGGEFGSSEATPFTIN